jgi:hypothetical protein
LLAGNYTWHLLPWQCQLACHESLTISSCLGGLVEVFEDMFSSNQGLLHVFQAAYQLPTSCGRQQLFADNSAFEQDVQPKH